MMNTPYPELARDPSLDRLRVELKAWNRGVERSRREYEAHPCSDLRYGAQGPNFARRKGDGCPVTVWDSRPARSRARRSLGGWTISERRCGEPVDRYGLCRKHADDRDRLGGDAA